MTDLEKKSLRTALMHLQNVLNMSAEDLHIYRIELHAENAYDELNDEEVMIWKLAYATGKLASILPSLT